MTLRALLAAAFALWLAPAQAEIWGYVDTQGVHFAAEKMDERYELFFRGGESFDTAEGIAAPGGRGARPRAFLPARSRPASGWCSPR
jgi:hypothetical protein